MELDWRRFDAQRSERRRDGDLDVLDPVMTPLAGNRQRLEVERIQRAVRDDDDAGASGV